MGVGGQRPGRFTPWKDPWYALYRRLYGLYNPAGRERKISLAPVFDPRTVQPAASRCTELCLIIVKESKDSIFLMFTAVNITPVKWPRLKKCLITIILAERFSDE
jgi:hypothetical protein